MPRVPPEQFSFCGPTNLLPSPVFDSQRSINLYPEVGSRGSKMPIGMTGRPGYTLFATLPNSPVRALWPGNGRLFAVGGAHVYEVNNAGGVVTDYGAMPQLGTATPCKFVQNGGSNAFQLIVLNPIATGIAGNMFNVNAGVLTAVYSGVDMDYLDGFQLAIASGNFLNNAGNPNQINSSNFGDATTWNALNFIIRTGASDKCNGLAVLNSLVNIFGAKTTEVWYDAGNNGFPLQRASGGQINLGLASTYSIVKFYNTILFLGSDGTGYAQVYMMQGMNPVRVSTASAEYLISLQAAAGALGNAVAFGYQEAGHTFYVLTFPATGYQIVYDLTTGMWHERVYASILPWCFASLTSFGFGGSAANFAGDALSGNIYIQSIQNPSDNGTAIVYTRNSGPVHRDNLWHTYDRFELDCDIGGAAATLNWSNDGGKNFGTQGFPLKQANNSAELAGSPSIQPRYWANQLGRARDRRFQTVISSSTQLIRIAQGLVDADESSAPSARG